MCIAYVFSGQWDASLHRRNEGQRIDHADVTQRNISQTARFNAFFDRATCDPRAMYMQISGFGVTAVTEGMSTHLPAVAGILWLRLYSAVCRAGVTPKL